MLKFFKYCSLLAVFAAIYQLRASQNYDSEGNERTQYVSYGGDTFKLSEQEKKQALSASHRYTGNSTGKTQYGIEDLSKTHPPVKSQNN